MINSKRWTLFAILALGVCGARADDWNAALIEETKTVRPYVVRTGMGEDLAEPNAAAGAHSATLLSDGTPVNMRLSSQLSGLLENIRSGSCSNQSFRIADEGIVDPADEYPSYLIGTRAFHETWVCAGISYDLGGYLEPHHRRIEWLQICEVNGKIKDFCRD